MAVKFYPEKHEYTSVDINDNISWISVTSVVSKYKEPFDAKKISEKCSKNKKSKWYGMTPEDIREAWSNEANKATDLGTWYHNQRESDVLACESITRADTVLPVFKPIEDNGIKVAPIQKLNNGVYPEHFVYLKSAGVCGQSDRVEVINNIIDIYDYKTNKEIKMNSYVNYENISKKMLGPVSHLDDSNYWHYALQLSFYMYMMLKHNPQCKPGKLCLDHVIFDTEENSEDRIIKLDSEGNPIIKDIVRYELPYLKAEVIAIINDLKK